MFKLFFVYPLILFVIIWLASDVEVGASVYSFDDNYISIEFPKEKFRSADSPDPWYSFYCNAGSIRDDLQMINDVVVN